MVRSLSKNMVSMIKCQKCNIRLFDHPKQVRKIDECFCTIHLLNWVRERVRTTTSSKNKRIISTQFLIFTG